MFVWDVIDDTFLSSSGWVTKEIKVRQINRRKCPNFIMDVHAGGPYKYKT